MEIIVLSHFSHCADKTPGKSSKGLFRLTAEGSYSSPWQRRHGGRRLRQLGTLHPQSGSRDEGMPVGAPCGLLFNSVSAPGPWNDSPHRGYASLSSLHLDPPSETCTQFRFQSYSKSIWQSRLITQFILVVVSWVGSRERLTAKGRLDKERNALCVGVETTVMWRYPWSKVNSCTADMWEVLFGAGITD